MVTRIEVRKAPPLISLQISLRILLQSVCEQSSAKLGGVVLHGPMDRGGLPHEIYFLSGTGNRRVKQVALQLPPKRREQRQDDHVVLLTLGVPTREAILDKPMRLGNRDAHGRPYSLDDAVYIVVEKPSPIAQVRESF